MVTITGLVAIYVRNKIPFHNREKELNGVMKILEAEPSLITFIYGPINSGKTTMISHLLEQHPEDYVPFYVNLDRYTPQLCCGWVCRSNV